MIYADSWWLYIAVFFLAFPVLIINTHIYAIGYESRLWQERQ